MADFFERCQRVGVEAGLALGLLPPPPPLRLQGALGLLNCRAWWHGVQDLRTVLPPAPQDPNHWIKISEASMERIFSR